MTHSTETIMNNQTYMVSNLGQFPYCYSILEVFVEIISLDNIGRVGVSLVANKVYLQSLPLNALVV